MTIDRNAPAGETGEDLEAFRRRGVLLLRLTLGAVALVAIAIGLLIHTFAPWLGLDADAHRVIATAFAGTGSVYGLAVWWWDRPG